MDYSISSFGIPVLPGEINSLPLNDKSNPPPNPPNTKSCQKKRKTVYWMKNAKYRNLNIKYRMKKIKNTIYLYGTENCNLNTTIVQNRIEYRLNARNVWERTKMFVSWWCRLEKKNDGQIVQRNLKNWSFKNFFF